ncbi:MAG: S1 RNA-binding domain-containing protein [Oscillospiraceae bacterium]|jgi:ribosomal protein S1|nr:S1 RNA-binding domain-containing protein [Oscillospiraceae bacterium]
MPRKKVETEVIDDEQALEAPDAPSATEPPPNPPPPEESPRPRRARAPKKAEPPGEATVIAAASAELPPKPPPRARAAPVLTIEAGGSVETPEDQAEQVWHEIRNALRTRKILTGTLGGMERGDNGSVIAVADYKGLRVAIPLAEMMINLTEDGGQRGEMLLRQSKILGNSLGAEIDFIVKGADTKTRSVVASRKDAMLKKRKLFYFDAELSKLPRVHEGRIVQARVIAVAEKVVRVEIFGAECAILARDLSYDWIGDARDYYHVGDETLVRVLEVKGDSPEGLRVRADVKSVADNAARDNLEKCKVQGKYAGKVTDVRRGSVFLRLGLGVNAIAHTCYDNRMPGKKDDVSFVVTHLDRERNVAMGIITRIIKQNL